MSDPYALYTADGDRLLVFSYAERRRAERAAERLILWARLLAHAALWR